MNTHRATAPRFNEELVGFRPIEETDLELLRGWRNAERVRSRMFDRSVISEHRQRNWWRERATDPLYRQHLLSYASEPLGTISFSSSAERRRTTCGYYVGADPAPARSGTLLLYKGLVAAFRERGERSVVCEIFADNEPSLRLVRRFGFREAGKGLAGSGRSIGQDTCLVFELTARAFEKTAPSLHDLLFAPHEHHALR
jgi:RimJ/RimL family protein N-acetyltransferase